VLVDWNPEYLYNKIIPDEKERQWFLSTICTGDWNELQDEGRSLQEGTEDLVRRYPEHESAIRAYYDRWKEMLGGPIHETVEIFRELKFHTSLKLYALTNWSAETFPVALELFDFLHWFDGRLVSGEEKIRKPFPEIYRLLIDRFSIDPTKAIYVDDNIRNVLPARELGFYGIHFRTPELFREELKGLGVL
jgi:2-haloacid dehalogenase